MINEMLTVQEITARTLLDLIRAGYRLVLTLSGGKNSPTTSFLGIEAIRRAVAEGFTQKHFVSSSDTLVENPSVLRHLVEILEEIRAFSAKHNLAFEVRTLTPSLASSFVVTTSGGAHSPDFPRTESIVRVPIMLTRQR